MAIPFECRRAFFEERNRRMTKFSIVRAGLLAGLVVASAAVGMLLQGEAHASRGHNHNFSVADVRGSYGVLQWGTIQGVDWTQIARISADGAGGLSIDFVGNIGDVTAVSGSTPCTYDVQHDGMGSMECAGEDGNVTVHFVIVDNGREIRFITAAGAQGAQAIGTARRQ